MHSGGEHLLSVIVVTFNEARHVARLQQSLRSLTLPPGVAVESILVDGGSRDGTAAEARQAGFDHVQECPGASIPVCRNLGARAAKGDWLAYVDGDCEVADDWLQQACPFLVEYEKVLLGWPARPPDPMNALQAAWNFHWLNKNRHMEEVLGQAVVQREGFRLATTRNMLLHRAVFDAVDGFNEELPTGEDTDFAFRVYMQGIPAFGLPTLRVWHHGEPATFGEFYRQQVWHANRLSYAHIRRISGGRIGGNAPRFAAAFLLAGLAGLAGLFSGLAGRPLWPAWWLWLFPWLAVVALPAVFVSWKGGSVRHFPMLCVLYALYGWARMWDLVGLARARPSWKSTAA
jgi:glycosyltransferase involved in cell wall biosynthesis